LNYRIILRKPDLAGGKTMLIHLKKNESQKGITGLETAIILIAFVIVASVLSYVVISAGLFSSQKAKGAVNSGLEQSGCTVELKGNVIAKMEEGLATELYFTVGLVPGGSAVDLTDTTEDKNKLTISYSDTNQQVPSLDWTMEMINADNGDKILDPGELAQITVDLAPITNLGPYVSFSLEVKPPDGSVLPIERTIPARVTDLVNLR
jgi:archaeal flagellin FlaB